MNVLTKPERNLSVLDCAKIIPSSLMNELRYLEAQLKDQGAKRIRWSKETSNIIRQQKLQILELEDRKLQLERLLYFQELEKRCERHHSNIQTCSTLTYKALANEITGYEEKMRILDENINRRKEVLDSKRQQLHFVHIRQSNRNNLLEKIASITTVARDAWQSCRKQHESLVNLRENLRSMIQLRISFHKKHVHASKLSLSRETTVIGSKWNIVRRYFGCGSGDDATVAHDIAERIKELREMIENNGHFITVRYRVNIYQKTDVLHEKVPDKEKIVKCRVILGRIKSVSGASDVVSICRKYMENEMDLFGVFHEAYDVGKKWDESFLAVRSLNNDVSSLRIKWKRTFREHRRRVDQLMFEIEDLRSEAFQLETEVDHGDAALENVKHILRPALERLIGLPAEMFWRNGIFKEVLSIAREMTHRLLLRFKTHERRC